MGKSPSRGTYGSVSVVAVLLAGEPPGSVAVDPMRLSTDRRLRRALRLTLVHVGAKSRPRPHQLTLIRSLSALRAWTHQMCHWVDLYQPVPTEDPPLRKWKQGLCPMLTELISLMLLVFDIHCRYSMKWSCVQTCNFGFGYSDLHITRLCLLLAWTVTIIRFLVRVGRSY